MMARAGKSGVFEARGERERIIHLALFTPFMVTFMVPTMLASLYYRFR
jgi:hypothetical protein